MARKVEYGVECPKCKVEGVTRMLGLDPEAGGICCDAPTPHVYEQLPGSETPVSEAAAGEVERPNLGEETQQAGDAPEVPQGSGESEQKRFSEIVQERAQSADTPQQPETPPVVSEGTIEIRKRGEEVVEEFSGITEGGSAIVGLGGKVGLPGGDLLFGLRVSEQWVSAIQAAADTCGQSFSEYLQDFINNFALLNEWADAPTSK